MEYTNQKNSKKYLVKTFIGFVAAFSFLVLAGNAFASGPQILTLPATTVTQSSMVINGNFSNGTGTTQVRFDWGTTPNMGTFTSYQSFASTNSQFSATISGLSTGTTYYFRAEGINGGGTGFGSTLNQSTTSYSSASVQTLPATSVVGTSATLNGWFNGNGSTTSTFFEYANNASMIGAYTTSATIQSQTSGSFSTTVSGLQPNTTYWYEAEATNNNGTIIATSAISFTTTGSGGGGGGSTCYINSFGPSTTISQGASATLSWSLSNCVSATISSIGSVNAYSGSTTVSPSGTTTYVLTATDPNGISTSQTAVVTVNGGNNNGSCTINSFYPSTYTIASGGQVEVSWTTSNCNNVVVSGGGLSSSQLSGSAWSTSLYGSTTFTITADGQTQTQTVSINGNNNNGNQCQVSSFYASPSTVNSGDTAYLYWSDPNCTYVTISGPGLNGGTYYGNSVTTNPIYASGTYYITGYGNNGASASANTYISLNTVPIYNNNNYYNGACEITSFYGTPSQVSEGNAAMLDWSTEGCSSVSISGGNLLSNNNYNQNLSGSVTTGALYGNTTYTLSAYGQNGTQQQSTTVTTFPISTIPTTPNYTNPTYTPTYTPPTTIIRYITVPGGSANTTVTNTGAPVVLGSTVEDMQGSSVIGNNLAGLALWGDGIFPTSVIGILILILLILAILVIARRIYAENNSNSGHH